MKAGDPQRQQGAGWLFVTPAIIVLGLFLVVPIAMALWVSLSDWTGRGSPFGGATSFVGLENYGELLIESGLARQDLMTSFRNTFYYVLGVVPLQTVLALSLAVLLNNKFLKGRSFFRTAFYFPSVVSSVAISALFLFLFAGSGAINKILAFFSINGPNWFQDPRGVIHLIGDGLGVWSIASPPDWLTNPSVLGLSLWEWFAGPSVALSAIMLQVVWTTAGTFMLMFLAALQDLPAEVEEAAMVDGANRWQRFMNVTVPHLRPMILLVATLGFIGTWQVFDQMYVMTQGGPAKTTLTPAYLSFQAAFANIDFPRGAAIAFILFALIFVLTTAQRYLLRDKDDAAQAKAARQQKRRQRKQRTRITEQEQRKAQTT
ncbi:MAG: carbohydrate ABC transporter permease [Ornithinimicrobium sp.]|jgi:multiple sugar transport system permease protein|uniref:carbohydrate ABC transporter permease n=1 Tax=Ornithinimicrobium sp. TaxID=1977084 RepID=UPI003D9B06CB